MWWTRLIGWFVSGGGKGLGEQIRLAHKDRLDAENNAQKLAADERMNLVAARVDAQTRGAGSFWAKVMRAGFALPIMLYNAKLIIWDKMLGWGTTDPLSPYLENVAWTIIAFYFLDNTIRFVRRG